jgi:SH3-like domain-containing protein
MRGLGIMRVDVLRIAVATAILANIAVATARAEPGPKTVSGLPIPRFVSLKSDKVNVRAGPTKDHDVTWIYSRAGLPVEITAEFETWRRIRDWEGAEGWVYHSLLSGRRTATIAPNGKNKDELLALRSKPEGDGAVVARLQVGVLASVKRCSGGWCRIAGDGFDGWIPQERLWGVYPNEKLE